MVAVLFWLLAQTWNALAGPAGGHNIFPVRIHLPPPAQNVAFQ